LTVAETNAVREKLRELLLRKKGIGTASPHRLVRRNATGPVPLSHAQRRLWLVDRLLGTTAEYNMPQALRLRGELDRDALRRAVQTIVDRHEILRTRFAEVNGEPVQIIEPELSIEIASGTPASRRLARRRPGAVIESALAEINDPFDLTRAPLLRVQLLPVSEHEHILLWTCHHIVSDAWSTGVFNSELETLYAAYRAGRANPLPPLPVQYADFALWQRERLDPDTLRRGLDYWKQQLAGAPERLDLPTDRPRPKTQTFIGHEHSVSVDSARLASLKEFGQRNGATLYMTLLAVFAALLERYTGQDDIVVGSPIANRQETQLEQLIGFFVNSLVMRVRVEPRRSFRALLADVRELTQQAFAHQDIPFERIVEELSPERSLSSTPMFQSTFALQNAPAGAQQLAELEIEPLGGGDVRVRFDLEVYAFEHANGLGLLWIYNRDLFDRWRIEQLARDYDELLDALLANPDAPLFALHRSTIAPAKLQQSDANVVALFEAQVMRDPEAIARTSEGRSLTYAALNARANQLAQHLIALGVKPETLVGVTLERSIELVIAVLGILKAGGAYVPIAPNLPAQRRRELIDDSALRHIVTLETLAQCADASSENPRVALRPQHPAYVNFTSGSTGTPKGVLVPHAAIVRLVIEPDFMNLDATTRMLHFAPLSFDAATLEIWGALLNGGTLIVMPAGLASAEELGGVLVNERVDTLWLTAGLFTQLVDHALPAFAGVRQLLAGGDVLSPEHVRKILHTYPKCSVINGYGPTENTTFSCCYTDAARRGPERRRADRDADSRHRRVRPRRRALAGAARRARRVVRRRPRPRARIPASRGTHRRAFRRQSVRARRADVPHRRSRPPAL
jgi:non-ribosomal peptide synthetase component F